MMRDLRWLASLLAFPLKLHRPLQLLCLVAALVVVPRYWAGSGAHSDPELRALERMEPGYLEALAQTASELPPAKASPAEIAAHGRAYPTLPLLLHAAAWRWGGLHGLLAAD